MKKLGLLIMPLMAIGFLANCNSANVKEFVVSFDSNGGSVVPEQRVKENGQIVPPDNPIKNGYAFKTWCTDEALTNEYDFSSLVTCNLILYAKWSDAISYTITYKNVDKSEHSNPESYTIETETIVLSNPTRDADWTFGGWYTEPEFNNQISSIVKGSHGDLTLYAKMIYKKTSLADCEWEEIKMVSEKGGARATFGEPGTQTKTVTVNNVENQVRIIAYDHDELSTSTNENPQYAGITFEFVNTISGYTTYWNNKQGSDSTNYDFINNSNLNDCLQPGGDVYKMIDPNLMAVIKTVNKKVDIHPNNKWIIGNYNTQLFPFSIDEIDGNDDGTYEYYKTDSQNRRVKNVDYWLRSPYTDSSNGAWRVSCYNGHLWGSFYVYTSAYVVAPAFCI